jgi:hypothetical protein
VLFGEVGEDEVGVVLGQESAGDLRAVLHALAEESAAAHRHARLAGVPAGAERVALSPSTRVRMRSFW